MSSIRPLLVSLAFAATLLTGCARSQPHADAAQTGATPTIPDTAGSGEVGSGTIGTGTIAGRILHPAHVVPALRICAIGSGAPTDAKKICIDTRSSQDTYRIDGLPPDDYIVLAAADKGVYRVGGHMQQVQCIRAPCPDMPASVTVAAGANVTGIDIRNFYDKRDDFPVISTK